MKTKNIMMLLLLLRTAVVAQNFDYSMEIEPVKESGYYQIPISMEMSGLAKVDLSDMRVNQSGVELPYIIKDVEKIDHSDFIPIEFKVVHSDKISEVFIQNRSKDMLYEIYLGMNNADIFKKVIIHGSDGDGWFIIKDSLRFNPSHFIDKESGLVKFSFPMTEYKTIRLTISNMKSAPLDIHSVFQLKYEFGQTSYQYSKPNKVVERVLKNNNSLYRLILNDTLAFERLDLSIENDGFYKRRAFVKRKSDMAKSGFVTISNFYIDSEKSMMYDFNRIKANELYLEIENGDNPPLKLKQAKVGEVRKVLVAHFKVGQPAKLNFGCIGCDRPNYDLDQFKDQLSTVSQSVVLNYSINKNVLHDDRIEHAPNDYRIFIWIGLILAGGVMVFFTISSFKSMEKND